MNSCPTPIAFCIGFYQMVMSIVAQIYIFTNLTVIQKMTLKLNYGYNQASIA